VADVQLYDAQTGAPITADAATAADLVRSGKAGFLADQKVAIQDQTGATRELSGTDAAAYLSSAEARFGGGGVGDAAVLQKQRQQEAFGGVGGAALAAVTGGLRGATLGLSDLALTGIGAVEADTLRNLQEANPLASLAGEGAGMIAPVLLSGGAGGAARAGVGAAEGASALRGVELAAGAMPSALAARAGGAVERAILGAAPGALERVTAGAASAAAEGALFGVGQEVSRATLRNESLSAEKLVASAGHGALLGGAVGGGLGAVGAVMRGAASKASDAGAAALRRFEQKEGALAGELAGAAPKTAEGVQALAGRAEREFALKSTGANQPQIQRLQAMGADIEARAVRTMADGELAQALGKDAKALLTAEEKSAAAALLRDERGKAVRAGVEEIKAAGGKIDVEAFVAEQRAAMAERLAREANPDLARAAKQTDEWLQQIETKIGDGDLVRVWETKSDLGKEAFRKGADTIEKDLKQDLYRALNDRIKTVGDDIAAKEGAEFAARWSNTNAEYRAANWLAEATEKGAARSASNRNFGLSEQLGAVAGVIVGGGGPAGLALAAGGAYANHLAKVYGADVGMQLARSVRQGEVVSTVERAFDQLLGQRAADVAGVARGALGALTGAAKVARPGVPLALTTGRVAEVTSARDQRQNFERTRDRLAAYQANPDARISAATAGLPPSTAAAVKSVVQRGADFLASKLPRRPLPEGVPAAIAKASQPSPDEISRFMRYARAVDDPLQVLEDARAGKLSAESVEAVKAVYPSVYQAIVETVQENLLARAKPLSWAEEVQLATLGIPVNDNLRPDAIKLFQDAYTSPAASPGPSAPVRSGAPSRPLNPPRLASRLDSLGEAP
jgi:hypothetical protein